MLVTFNYTHRKSESYFAKNRDLILAFMDRLLEALHVLQLFKTTSLWLQMLVILVVFYQGRVRYSCSLSFDKLSALFFLPLYLVKGIDGLFLIYFRSMN